MDQWSGLLWKSWTSLKLMRALPNHKLFPETQGELWWMKEGRIAHGTIAAEGKNDFEVKSLCRKQAAFNLLLPEQFGCRSTWAHIHRDHSLEMHTNYMGGWAEKATKQDASIWKSQKGKRNRTSVRFSFMQAWRPCFNSTWKKEHFIEKIKMLLYQFYRSLNFA